MNKFPQLRILAGLLVTIIVFPVSAQSLSQLKQENARLLAQIQALQTQGCGVAGAGAAEWNQGAITAKLDAIRVGQHSDGPGQQDGNVTVALTLRNSGQLPIALNYRTGTFRLIDEAGHEYNSLQKAASGIPTANSSHADSTAIMNPGTSRTVTFSAFRVPSAGQPPGRLFDINATFIQIEDRGRGQISKVRDYQVAFTNAPASGGGFSTDRTGHPSSPVADRVINGILNRIIK